MPGISSGRSHYPATQSWISEEEVTTWLSKYDWDKSGDISFAEFAALVSCDSAVLCATLTEVHAFNIKAGPSTCMPALITYWHAHDISAPAASGQGS